MIADLMSRHDNLHTVLMAYNMGEKGGQKSYTGKEFTQASIQEK